MGPIFSTADSHGHKLKRRRRRRQLQRNFLAHSSKSFVLKIVFYFLWHVSRSRSHSSGSASLFLSLSQTVSCCLALGTAVFLTIFVAQETKADTLVTYTCTFIFISALCTVFPSVFYFPLSIYVSVPHTLSLSVPQSGPVSAWRLWCVFNLHSYCLSSCGNCVAYAKKTHQKWKKKYWKIPEKFPFSSYYSTVFLSPCTHVVAAISRTFSVGFVEVLMSSEKWSTHLQQNERNRRYMWATMRDVGTLFDILVF